MQIDVEQTVEYILRLTPEEAGWLKAHTRYQPEDIEDPEYRKMRIYLHTLLNEILKQ